MPEASYSPKDVAQFAYNAGFRGQALVIATAIAMAESGGRAAAMGDTGIETGTWGPSVGLWQIRSVKAQTGKGGARDQQINVDPGQNAQHAFAISGGGKNFGPWSTYGNGAYSKFLNVAQQAAQGISNNATVNTLDNSAMTQDTTGNTSQPQQDLHSVGTQLGFFKDMLAKYSAPQNLGVAQ